MYKKTEYKDGKEGQLWITQQPRNILGVDCSVKRVVTSVIGCGTPTSSMLLQEEISEPAFVSETQYGDLHASPFVSMAIAIAIDEPIRNFHSFVSI